MLHNRCTEGVEGRTPLSSKTSETKRTGRFSSSLSQVMSYRKRPEYVMPPPSNRAELHDGLVCSSVAIYNTTDCSQHDAKTSPSARNMSVTVSSLLLTINIWCALMGLCFSFRASKLIASLLIKTRDVLSRSLRTISA